MPRDTSRSIALPQPRLIGALMLGAALALVPVLGHAQEAAKAAPAAQTASASLQTADGKDAGKVTIEATPSGALHVVMDLSGLPAGERAVHIHETGKCEGPAFESAGGHLTGGKEHGAMAAGGMHTGDLPNIRIGENGAAQAEFFIPATSVADVIDADGAAFVVHGKTDDYASQPSGNAGDRIACGVFQSAAK